MWPPPCSAAASCAKRRRRRPRRPVALWPHPAAHPAGSRLRQAARLLSALAYLTGDRSLTPIVLITKLAALAEAVAELRESQRHAARPPLSAPPLNQTFRPDIS
jgi:hypothetical protein